MNSLWIRGVVHNIKRIFNLGGGNLNVEGVKVIKCKWIGYLAVVTSNFTLVDAGRAFFPPLFYCFKKINLPNGTGRSVRTESIRRFF